MARDETAAGEPGPPFTNNKLLKATDRIPEIKLQARDTPPGHSR